MVKVAPVSALIAVSVAACATNPAQPPPAVWTSNYAVPFDVMVNCLATAPAGAFSVSAPVYAQDGSATIYVAPVNAPPPRSQYIVRRMAGNASQVSWQRPANVGGFDWVDGDARTRAERCGGNS